MYLQTRRDGVAAKRFFKRLLRSHGSEPRKIVTDKLRSYGVAHRVMTFTALSSMKIIGQNSRMRLPGFVSEGCISSNQLVRRSGFLGLMRLSVTCLIWADTGYGQSTIETSGSLRLQSGVGRLLEVLRPDSLGFNALTCQYPPPLS